MSFKQVKCAPTAAEAETAGRASSYGASVVALASPAVGLAHASDESRDRHEGKGKGKDEGQDGGQAGGAKQVAMADGTMKRARIVGTDDAAGEPREGLPRDKHKAAYFRRHCTELPTSRQDVFQESHNTPGKQHNKSDIISSAVARAYDGRYVLDLASPSVTEHMGNALKHGESKSVGSCKACMVQAMWWHGWTE